MMTQLDFFRSDWPWVWALGVRKSWAFGFFFFLGELVSHDTNIVKKGGITIA